MLVVSTIASLLAAYTAIRGLQLEGKSREADTQLRKTETSVELIMRLQLQYSSDTDFLARRRDAGLGLLKGEHNSGLIDVLNFFERLGFFVQNDIVDVSYAKSVFGGAVAKYWVISRDYINSERELEKRPNLWQEMEHLFNHFQDIEESKYGQRWANVLSDEAKVAFLTSEANIRTKER